MIFKSHAKVTLLKIDNLHSTGCGEPPSIDAAKKYVSYFENRLGEQWVLVGDPVSGKALVYAGDCHWGKAMEVSLEAPCPRTTLQGAEKMWLIACLAAMGNKRFDDVLSRYNFKQSGSEN